MSYAFSTEKVGSVKLRNFHYTSDKNLVLVESNKIMFTFGTLFPQVSSKSF